MSLQVLNPVAHKASKKGASAPRLTQLSGKRVGLYWNRKAGGDAALKRTETLLKERYPGIEIRSYERKSLSQDNPSAIKDDLRRIAQECTAVIGSTAE